MEPSEILKILWKLKGVVDTGFATDTDTRRSVTGYLIYFCDALIAWKSRLQKNVTLSSKEGEYVGLGKISTEILFVCDVLVFWELKSNTQLSYMLATWEPYFWRKMKLWVRGPIIFKQDTVLREDTFKTVF